MEWGMSEKLGFVHYGNDQANEMMSLGKDYSEKTAQIIDDEICALVKGIEKEINTLLEAHRPQLESLAEALLEKETLKAEEIQAIVGKLKTERE